MEKAKPRLYFYEFAIQVGIWAPFVILRIILILVGWVVVPLAAAMRLYQWKLETDGVGNPRWQAHFTVPFLWLWDNDEDGIANDTYVKFNSEIMQIIYWSCWRNPVNNLRFVPLLSVKINPLHVRYLGSYGSHEGIADLYDRDDLVFWYYCWHGVYSNFRVHFKFFRWRMRFWLGFKIYPGDIHGVKDHRRDSAGFANQLKVIS